MKRTVLPGFAEKGGGDLDLGDLKEELLDLAHAKAAGVEAGDGLVEAVEAALVLGNGGGLEAAGAVARGLDLELPSSLCRVLELWPLRELGSPAGMLRCFL